MIDGELGFDNWLVLLTRSGGQSAGTSHSSDGRDSHLHSASVKQCKTEKLKVENTYAQK